MTQKITGISNFFGSGDKLERMFKSFKISIFYCSYLKGLYHGVFVCFFFLSVFVVVVKTVFNVKLSTYSRNIVPRSSHSSEDKTSWYEIIIV